MTKNRNMLTFREKFAASKWMNKHLAWCHSKGLTGVSMAEKAANELGFPVTVSNLRGLWVRDLENTWPFTRDVPSGRTTLSAVQFNCQLLAKALCELYGRLGSLEDLDPDVRHLAEHILPVAIEGGD